MPESTDAPKSLGSVFAWMRRRLEGNFDLESTGRLIMFSVVVGIVAGLGAAAFFWCLEHMQQWALGEVLGYEQPGAGTERTSLAYHLPSNTWAVVLIPTIGGLLSGILIYTYAPEAEGHGTDAMVRTFHRLKGVIRPRVPLIKSVASILTLGTGGSAGREGPIAQIAAGFGSFLASRLKLSDFERRQLVLAGAAGGIGAIFRAPLGGALFVGEVLYSTSATEFSSLVPSVISSVVAYTVFAAIFGPGFAFTTPEPLTFHGPKELPFYLVFGMICAIVGFIYVKFFYKSRDLFFHRLPMPNHFKPAIGGLMLGVMAIWLPQVMAGGYGWIQLAIDGDLGALPIQLMAVLVFAKIAATSFTISSGGSGGVFAPSLFIGAMLGGAYGQYCHQMFPSYVPQPTAFVLVGMGGFFAGVAKVPLTALLMVSEMSGSYELIVPLMLVSVLTVTMLSSKVTLYEEQVPSLIDSPAHLGDFVVDVLARIRVDEVFDRRRKLELVPENMPLSKVLSLVARSHHLYFPVVDDDELLTGIFSLRDVRAAFEGHGAKNLIVAADLATFPVLTVNPDDDLHKALRRFTVKNIDEIPVVDPEEPRRVIGLLRRRDVIAAYDRHFSLNSDQAKPAE
ncbi:MAG: chloride channel protein [Planctomycetales bacterium]|nr:chloride channel protein [Planctomycetales bacterium]